MGGNSITNDYGCRFSALIRLINYTYAINYRLQINRMDICHSAVSFSCKSDFYIIFGHPIYMKTEGRNMFNRYFKQVIMFKYFCQCIKLLIHLIW